MEPYDKFTKLLLVSIIITAAGIVSALTVHLFICKYAPLQRYTVVVHHHESEKDYYIAKGEPHIVNQTTTFTTSDGRRCRLSGSISTTSYESVEEAEEGIRKAVNDGDDN